MLDDSKMGYVLEIATEKVVPKRHPRHTMQKLKKLE